MLAKNYSYVIWILDSIWIWVQNSDLFDEIHTFDQYLDATWNLQHLATEHT